jgi:enoyl-CoA hydratase/carnithine racemase
MIEAVEGRRAPNRFHSPAGSVSRGISPTFIFACGAVSYFLPRLVGTSVASELMLTGRFILAPRALATGLVSEVVPDDRLAEAAQSYVDDMLYASPMGLRLTKDGLNHAIDATSLESSDGD